MTDRRATVVLVLACVALYGRSIDFGLVRADDTDLIEGNAEFLSSLANIPRAFGRSFFESGGVLTDLKTYYRPLAVLSFMVDAAIAGTNPAIYHLTNVLLHTAVVVLLFMLLRAMSRGAVPGPGRDFFAALIFAVHPANVHTVCWIMGRNELLLAAFSLIAFGSFLYLKGRVCLGRRSSLIRVGVVENEARASSHERADEATASSHKNAALIIHTLAFASAVFSKETGVVLLALLFFYDCLQPDHAGPAGAGLRDRKSTAPENATSARARPSIAESGFGRRRMARLIVLDLAVLLIWWGLRDVALSGGVRGESVSLRAIVANAPQLLVYLEKIVFPVRLNPMPGVDHLSLLFGAVATAVLVVLLARGLGIHRVAFVAAWFLAFLLPALLVPGLPAYEHRLYVPMIGLALAFACRDQGSGIRDRKSRTLRPDKTRSLKPKIQSPIPALTLAAVFFVISFRYAGSFRTPLTYWSRGTESSQFAPIAHVNVGQIFQDIDRPDEAEAHFRRAPELNPRTPKAHNNLGVALMQLGRRREAFEAFTQELRFHPWNADAHHNLGLFYKEEGNAQEAILKWEETLRLNKYYLPAYEQLARLYAARGEREKAAWYEARLRELQTRSGQ